MTLQVETGYESHSELEIIADRIEQAEQEADSLMKTISESRNVETLALLGATLQAIEIRIARLKQEFKEADSQV
jgi:hypothetical protein